MAFADVQKSNASFISAGPLSETIDYRPKGISTWTSVPAQVNRMVRSITGELVNNEITVFVSKTSVAATELQGDLFRLAAVELGETRREYRVVEVAAKSGGFYLLRCVG